MNVDSGWKLILLLGAVLVGAIMYNHLKRDQEPHAAMKNLSPDGAEFVTPILRDIQTPEAEVLPSRVAEDLAQDSKAAWQNGEYEIIPSDPGLLVLENGFERKAFFMSQATVGGCSFSQGRTCLFGPDFETPISEKLPARLRMQGTSADELRKAPRWFMAEQLETPSTPTASPVPADKAVKE